MAGSTLNTKLSKLNYSLKWMEFGFLTESKLNEQIDKFDRGEDDNTEHYRYEVIFLYIQSKEHFDDDTLSKIAELMRMDEDKSMASSVLIMLLKDPRLNVDQFELIAEALRSFGERVLKYIEKARLNK